MAQITDIYADAKGRKFGTWARSPWTTSDLMESPGFIMESLLRDELGVATANVDTASFDFVANTGGKRGNDSWKYARSLKDLGSSTDYVAELAYESGSVSCRDPQGRERIVPLDFNIPDINFSTTALTTSDIEWDNGKPSVHVNQSPISSIRNEFYLNYKFNYGSGAYDKQLYITASATNMSSNTRDNTDTYGATYTALCTNSQSYYNKTERWTYSSNWIRSDSVAELFLKLMANWLAIRKWEVAATLIYNSLTLRYELLDMCFWNITLLPSAIRTNVGFLIDRLVDGGMVKPAKIDIHCVQVPIILGTLGYGSGFGYGYGTEL